MQFASFSGDNPAKAAGIVLKATRNQRRLRALTYGITAATVLIFAFQIPQIRLI